MLVGSKRRRSRVAPLYGAGRNTGPVGGNEQTVCEGGFRQENAQMYD